MSLTAFPSAAYPTLESRPTSDIFLPLFPLFHLGHTWRTSRPIKLPKIKVCLKIKRMKKRAKKRAIKNVDFWNFSSRHCDYLFLRDFSVFVQLIFRRKYNCWREDRSSAIQSLVSECWPLAWSRNVKLIKRRA